MLLEWFCYVPFRPYPNRICFAFDYISNGILVVFYTLFARLLQLYIVADCCIASSNWCTYKHIIWKFTINLCTYGLIICLLIFNVISLLMPTLFWSIIFASFSWSKKPNQCVYNYNDLNEENFACKQHISYFLSLSHSHFSAKICTQNEWKKIYIRFWGF